MSELSRITDRYRLDKLVHASDAASVFRAVDLRSRRVVALKLIRSAPALDASDPGAPSAAADRARFESACEALGDCNHPSIPRLLDFGVTGTGETFLTVEYLLGATFDLLSGSPAARLLPLLLPILDALEELDRHGISHRNLYAENLLVVPRGGDEEEIKLLGWGSATADASDEGRRADLRAFAELTCAAIEARIDRGPALVVNLRPEDENQVADASELAILLSLLLQPGGAMPSSLASQLRLAFRHALSGNLPKSAIRRSDAGPPARPAPEPGRAAAAPDPAAARHELDQAVRADITMAVPRDILYHRPGGSTGAAPAAAAAAAAESAAGSPAFAGTAGSAADAGGVRTETLPTFLPADLSSTRPGLALAPEAPPPDAAEAPAGTRQPPPGAATPRAAATPPADTVPDAPPVATAAKAPAEAEAQAEVADSAPRLASGEARPASFAPPPVGSASPSPGGEARPVGAELPAAAVAAPTAAAAPPIAEESWAATRIVQDPFFAMPAAGTATPFGGAPAPDLAPTADASPAAGLPFTAGTAAASAAAATTNHGLAANDDLSATGAHPWPILAGAALGAHTGRGTGTGAAAVPDPYIVPGAALDDERPVEPNRGPAAGDDEYDTAHGAPGERHAAVLPFPNLIPPPRPVFPPDSYAGPMHDTDPAAAGPYSTATAGAATYTAFDPDAAAETDAPSPPAWPEPQALPLHTPPGGGPRAGSTPAGAAPGAATMAAGAPSSTGLASPVTAASSASGIAASPAAPALAAGAASPTAAASRPAGPRTGAAGARRRPGIGGLLAVGALVIVALVAGAVALLWRPLNSRPARSATAVQPAGASVGGAATARPPAGPAAPGAAQGAGGAPAAGAAAPIPPAAAPAAAPPTDPRLIQADAQVAAGDVTGARRTLEKISAADQAALAPADHEAYDRLVATVASGVRAAIAADLAAGLRRGDLRRLNAALTAAKRETGLPAGMRRDLDRARQAADLDAQLARPDPPEGPAEALRDATALLALVPRYGRAAELRDGAAKALEQQTDAATAAGDADRAAKLLAALRQAWPDRAGLAERGEQVETLRRGDQRAESALAAAERAETAGQPLQGLDALAAATPTSRYRDRFRQARERLNQLLAKLDANPPSVAFRAGFKPEYDKGARITIPLRITDDLAVKTTDCWVRAEGETAYQSLPVHHVSGADYEVAIPAELHQNRTLEIYLVATDPSGHQGTLGTRDKPLKIKRRNWIEKIFIGKQGQGT